MAYLKRGSVITEEILGTIKGGTWEATDVAVAHGGTGASTLTDGGVLMGSGTGAISATAVLADNQLLVGDGTTDPAVESGSTLMTSITEGNTPQFNELTHGQTTTGAGYNCVHYDHEGNHSGSGAFAVTPTYSFNQNIVAHLRWSGHFQMPPSSPSTYFHIGMNGYQTDPHTYQTSMGAGGAGQFTGIWHTYFDTTGWYGFQVVQYYWCTLNTNYSWSNGSSQACGLNGSDLLYTLIPVGSYAY